VKIRGLVLPYMVTYAKSDAGSKYKANSALRALYGAGKGTDSALFLVGLMVDVLVLVLSPAHLHTPVPVPISSCFFSLICQRPSL